MLDSSFPAVVAGAPSTKPTVVIRESAHQRPFQNELARVRLHAGKGAGTEEGYEGDDRNRIARPRAGGSGPPLGRVALDSLSHHPESSTRLVPEEGRLHLVDDVEARERLLLRAVGLLSCFTAWRCASY
jgi:hypothetical protein